MMISTKSNNRSVSNLSIRDQLTRDRPPELDSDETHRNFTLLRATGRQCNEYSRDLDLNRIRTTVTRVTVHIRKTDK